MTLMSSSHSENSSTCNCNDEQHKEKTVNHKHTDNECIHEDGTRHKLHRQTS
jgi:hypothetical protein